MFGTYDKNVSTMKWPSLTAKIGKRRKKSFIGSAPKDKKRQNEMTCYVDTIVLERKLKES